MPPGRASSSWIPSWMSPTAVPGVAELDTMLPLLYTEGVLTGRLSPERFVALTVDQRRPPVRHVPAQGNHCGRLRRRHRDLGDPRAAHRARRRPVLARRATASTLGASCAPGRRPPFAAASWCSRAARRWASPAAAGRLRRGPSAPPARAEPSPSHFETTDGPLPRPGWYMVVPEQAPSCFRARWPAVTKTTSAERSAARPAARSAARRRDRS